MAGKKRPKKKRAFLRKGPKGDGKPGSAVQPTEVEGAGGPETAPATPGAPNPPPPGAATTELVRVLAQVATSLWYLKTKHFKQQWQDPAAGLDDPRERRAVGRVEKAVEALASVGVEVEDPTERRYAVGSEGLMKPIEFVPTAGITHERVTETMRPIVFVKGHLVQRAEVFVAVPNAPVETSETAGES